MNYDDIRKLVSSTILLFVCVCFLYWRDVNQHVSLIFPIVSFVR